MELARAAHRLAVGYVELAVHVLQVGFDRVGPVFVLIGTFGPGAPVVLLRCGQCGTWRKDTFADDTLDRFDRKLDEAARQIAEEADRLRREWRSTEADAFAAVLDRDLIDAGDLAS
jgi:hypothetical protein